MAGLPKRPELKLSGNVAENFKNFEMRFHDYCIQADYRDLDKNSETEKDEYYKKPRLEIASLRSSMPDEALQIIRYTIEPQIPQEDMNKPWVLMDKLRTFYTGTIGSSLMTDRFKFWCTNQLPHESVQDWEVKVRQAGILCNFTSMADEMCRDKFVFGLHNSNIRTELLKTHLKADNSKKLMSDVVGEAKALESAQKANKLINDSGRSIDEQVHWTKHSAMKLRREPGRCHWCGDRRGPHSWRACPAKGKVCDKCGINDHFVRVCLHQESQSRGRGPSNRSRGRGGRFSNQSRNQFDSSQGGNRWRPNRDNHRQTHHLDTDHTIEQYNDALDQEDDYQIFSLDAQVHNINTESGGKKYFVNLPSSDKGSQFKTVKYQIDSAATCNTTSEETVKKEFPQIKLKKSPYILHPYGDSKPLYPVGQIDLICQRENRYHLLQFQVLPKHDMKGKPALLSGSDSEKIVLIEIKADEMYTLSSQVTRTVTKGNDLPGYQVRSRSDTQTTENSNPTTHSDQAEASTVMCACSRLDDVHQRDTSLCNIPQPRPSTPIRVSSKRPLPQPGKLTKEDILSAYPENFEGVGFIGPSVHFKVKEDASPIQMPIHRVPVVKREREKIALDKYVEAGILAKVEEPTPWCSNILIRETNISNDYSE